MPSTGSGSEDSGFSWGSLIPIATSLGSKILGNKLAPDSSQQSINLQKDIWNAQKPYDLSTIPQPTAQQFGTSSELQRMLSGQGYDPKTLAEMHAGATQNPANAGLQEMSQMKRLLGQSGLANTAAAASYMGNVARQTGQAQVAANRDVDLANANAGLENFRTGVQEQTQIGLSNMQAANTMALDNANRMFQAMQWNAAHGGAGGVTGGGASTPTTSTAGGSSGSSGPGVGNIIGTGVNLAGAILPKILGMGGTGGLPGNTGVIMNLGSKLLGGGSITGIGGPISTIGSLGGALGSVGSAIGSGLGAIGSAIGGLASNPVTAPVAAALGAAVLWKKSQVHPTADKFVQGYQDPFVNTKGTGKLNLVVDGFDRAYTSGQLSKADAQTIRDATAQLIQQFMTDGQNFAQKGGKETTVWNQALRTMTQDFGGVRNADGTWTPDWSKILGKMDQEIAGLA